jgi:peroxiredoxin
MKIAALGLVLLAACATTKTTSDPGPSLDEKPHDHAAHGQAPADTSRLGRGMDAPDFSLPDAKGAMRARADLGGDQPLVVMFFQGAWCHTCRETLSRMEKALDNEHGTKPRVVAISADPPAKAGKLAENLALSFPVLADVELLAARAYGVADAVNGLAFAAIFVVGPDGKILWSRVGDDPFAVDQALDAARVPN